MSSQKSSYRQIVKATSIFGGVQVILIIIAIVRSKFIAVLLGPIGMGIAALLNSTLSIIGNLTEFGLSTSAVKNVASAYSSGDSKKVEVIVAVLRRWVWLTGLLGFILALILAPWLSKIAFGNKEYTVAFIVISITLLFTQISGGQSAVLRGTRQIKYLAKSGVIGAVLGLIISVPLYYFFGKGGIVPAIVLTSVSGLLLTWYFSNKVPIERVKVSKETVIREGRGMLTLGFMLSLTTLITLGASYVVRIFISQHGSISEVGLYNAGFTMVTTYVGLVFTAMATDYYPRLAGVAHDRITSGREINQQAEIAILILAPILTVFIIYINWAVVLLYSKEFLAINSMMQWAALGILLKAASWTMSILILAKGASKVFFWNELIANIYQLLLNLLGYYYGGLTGLGISFLIGNVLYVVQVFIVTKWLYEFRFYRSFYLIFFIQLTLAVICLLLVQLKPGVYAYIFGSVIILGCFLFSYKELDKRMGMVEVMKQQLRKFKR